MEKLSVRKEMLTNVHLNKNLLFSKFCLVKPYWGYELCQHGTISLSHLHTSGFYFSKYSFVSSYVLV